MKSVTWGGRFEGEECTKMSEEQSHRRRFQKEQSRAEPKKNAYQYIISHTNKNSQMTIRTWRSRKVEAAANGSKKWRADCVPKFEADPGILVTSPCKMAAGLRRHSAPKKRTRNRNEELKHRPPYGLGQNGLKTLGANGRD